MRAFYLTRPEQKIRQTVSGESTSLLFSNTIDSIPSSIASLASRFPLPWSAYVRLLTVKTREARAFYETEALRSGWSVRQLDRQIQSQFYERTALSKNKAAMLEKAAHAEPGDAITPEEAIKDPFVLEFLNLKDEYSESELEEALISHLADFLLELGDDFAVVDASAAFASTTTGSASTLSSFTADCAASSSSNSRSASSATQTPARCTST